MTDSRSTWIIDSRADAEAPRLSQPSARAASACAAPPANDDRESVGQLLYHLQQRPSAAIYWAAILFALVWLGAGAALMTVGFELAPADLVSAATYRGNPGLIGALVAVLLPPLFFVIMGALIWRIQEMRYVARSMTQVAFRLVEPETIASESITSVGQAIRREVAAMGDGIDRALARASELEIMVHNEVSMLERSYSENELRIRSIVEDLTTQREAIVNNADRVRSAIVVAHEDLTLALGSVAGRISTEVSEAGLEVMRSFGDRGSELTEELGKAGDEMVKAMGERSSSLIERMAMTADEVNRALNTSSERVAGTVSERVAEIAEQLGSRRQRGERDLRRAAPTRSPRR